MGPLEQRTSDILAIATDTTGKSGVDLSRFMAQRHRLNRTRRLTHLPNIGAALMSIEFKTGGPVVTYVDGICGGQQALLAGIRMIQEGEADTVICGAVDGADSQSNRTRSDAGAGVLVLENETLARRRGCIPYAVCLGGALRTAMHPGQVWRAVEGVLADAPDADLAVWLESVSAEDPREKHEVELAWRGRCESILHADALFCPSAFTGGFRSSIIACLAVACGGIRLAHSWKGDYAPGTANEGVAAPPKRAIAVVVDTRGSAGALTFERPDAR
jgi:hypothetical protein